MSQQDRDRARRGNRPSRFDNNADRDRSGNRSTKGERRIFVSNIPYSFKIKDLKDLFMERVGEPSYVELFHDESQKFRGTAIVEFPTADSVSKALEVMHRQPVSGRFLVLKEDFGNERDQYGFINKAGKTREDRDRGDRNRDNRGHNMSLQDAEMFNSYGLSAQFLDSIGVQPPLLNRVFVANLDYKVTAEKLKEVFKMAGKVRFVDMNTDKDGNSRGMAVIVYDHPVEAVQAISMFNKHNLYERKMTVRMDRDGGKTEMRLPEGLRTIGLGLGPNGEPIRDIVRNLPQNQNSQAIVSQGGNPVVPGILGAVPAVVNGLEATLGNASASINPLANLNLQALGLLQNQLIQQGLTGVTGGLGLGSNSELTGNSPFQQLAGIGGGSLNFGRSSLGGIGAASGLGGGALGASSSNGRLGSVFDDQNNHGNSASNSSASYNRKDEFIGDGAAGKVSDMILVGNVPPSVSWQMLKDKFRECGDVVYAELNGNDTAIIKFSRVWDAERAIKKFNRTRIDGRTIDVSFY